MDRTAFSLGGLMLLTLLDAGCQTPASRPDSTSAYVRALREGRLGEAYALTSASYRRKVSSAEFAQRWSHPEARANHADDIQDALEGLHARAPELDGAPQDLERQAAAQRALHEFAHAASTGHFEEAYALLAAPLRARYTPERLAKDFAVEPSARDRLARAEQAGRRPPVLKGPRAEFPIAPGRTVVLTCEEGPYRILALE